jgi:curved DNA-binding protein CbpA
VNRPDPYEVLGVRADASDVELHRSYLALARRHHPDYYLEATPSARAAAEARMREVNDAWDRVGTPARRRSYDAARQRSAEGAGFQPFAWVSDDDADPREAPDVPYRATPPPTNRSRVATLAPVLLFAASVAMAVLGGLAGIPGVLALAVALFLLSCVGFLVVPLRALSQARRDEG